MLNPLLASWPPEAKVALIAGAILVAAAAARVLRRRAAIFPAQLKHNGIAVGDTKVYDNRSLVLMLEQLKDQLKELQKLDGPKPSDAIGTQQAASSVSTTVSAGMSGGGKDAGKPDGGGGGAGEGKAADPAPLKWSERATDLLADQVNLNYDIFNLQLLLERAISDRMMPLASTKACETQTEEAGGTAELDTAGTGEEGAPQGEDTGAAANARPTKKRPAGRVQAVLGIPISLDPPAYAAGCAAIVEVRLRAEYPLSLVVLFPQEDTYNTAISGHRRASFSASVNQPGTAAAGTFDSARDSSAIRREADTVAFQRADGSPNELLFGWEFFPAAGSPSVSPGMRQMLAVVSLAQADDNDPNKPVKLSIETRTRWRQYNSTTLTVTDRCGPRVLLTNRPVESSWSAKQSIEVLKTKSIEDGLHPIVHNIRCYRVGETAVVVVKGDNFFPGTSVVMGDQVHDGRETGLVLKSSRVMQIQTPLGALTSAAVLNGRYGTSKELCIDPARKFNLPPLSIQSTQIIPTNETGYVIRMLLGPREGTGPGAGGLRVAKATPPLMNALRKLARPVLAIDGRCVSSDVNYSPEGDGSRQVWANVSVDKATVRTPISMLLRLTFPLCGPDWSLEYQTYDLRPGVRVVRRVEQDKTRLFFSGAIFGLDPNLMVWFGQGYSLSQDPNVDGLTMVGRDLLILTVDTRVASTYNWLFFFSSWGSRRIDIEDSPAGGQAVGHPGYSADAGA